MVLAGLLAVLASMMVAADAQEKSKSRSRKSTAAATSKSKSKARSDDSDAIASAWRRLPTGFGSLKLTDEQKEEIYAARVNYGGQIDELEEQIRELRAQMMEECEGALTSTQKKALATALAKRASPSKSDVKKASASKTSGKASSSKTSSRRKSSTKKDE
jgi:Spy/CpxP family protein refolding chaperone